MIYDGEAYSPLPATILPYTVGGVPDLGFVYQIRLNDHAELSGRNPADGSAHNADDIKYATSGLTVDAEISKNNIKLLSIYPSTNKTLSNALAKLINNEAMTVAFIGDSLTYGLDVVTGTGAPINGSGDARALTPFPESFGSAMQKIYPTLSVLNKGFPGDTTREYTARWGASTGSDISFIMYGTNDAIAVGSDSKVPASEYEINLVEIIKNEQSKGSAVILLIPPRFLEPNYSLVKARQQYIRTFENIIIKIGQQFGIPVFNTAELIASMGEQAFSDGVHLNAMGYNELGYNLSASLLQLTVNKNSLSVGDRLEVKAGNMLGLQTADASGNRLMTLTSTINAAISGYFEEDCAIEFTIRYSSTVGGTQRVKAMISGGASRNGAMYRDSVAIASSGTLSSGYSDTIPKGYRTIVFSVTSTTTTAYLDSVRVISPSDIPLLDSNFISNDGMTTNSALSNLAVTNSTGSKWIVDRSKNLRGDYIVESSLDGVVVEPYSMGISLIFDYSQDTGAVDRYLSVLRVIGNRLFVRYNVAGSNVDTVFTGAFTSASVSSIKVVRESNDFKIYAENILITTISISAYKSAQMSLYVSGAQSYTSTFVKYFN